MRCIVCKKSLVRLIEAYASLPRVGSDSRPLPSGGRLGQCEGCGAVQKPVDDKFQAECEAIYSSYVMYAQSSEGAEPKIFDDAPCGRSTRLVEVISSEIGLGATGSLLDVGCGNGNLLRAFGSACPAWSLAGLALDDRHRVAVEAICGGGSLLTGELAKVEGRFDVVVAMHVLEHLTEPVDFLCQVKEKLVAEGVVVIQLRCGERILSTSLWRIIAFILISLRSCVWWRMRASSRCSCPGRWYLVSWSSLLAQVMGRPRNQIFRSTVSARLSAGSKQSGTRLVVQWASWAKIILVFTEQEMRPCG